MLYALMLSPLHRSLKLLGKTSTFIYRFLGKFQSFLSVDSE